MRRTPLLVALVSFLLIAPQSQGVSPRAALNLMLPELNFTGVTLADSIDFLRDASGANIHVDWKALEAVGVGRDTTINLRVRQITMRKALELMLREAGSGDMLSFFIDDSIIEVTTREIANSTMFVRLYPVDDLIMDVPDFVGPDFNIGDNPITGPLNGDEEGLTRLERVEQLIDIIQDVIEPDAWDTNGGQAAIRYFNGSLIVRAPRSVHEALGTYVD